MNHGLRITTIIPNFNHGHLISRALDSLLNQTFSPFEIIVIDDASTDSSIEIIKKYISLSNKIRLITLTKNIGALEAGKIATNKSLGNYLHFFAADDELLPEAYAVFEKAYELYPNKPFYSGEAVLNYVDFKSTTIRPLIRPSNRVKYIDCSTFSNYLRKGDNYIMTMSTIVNKSKFFSNGGFDFSFGPQCDSFFFRKMALAEGFVFSPSIITNWNVSLKGLSRQQYMESRFVQIEIPRVKKMIIEDSVFPSWYADIYSRRQRFLSKRILLQESLSNVEFAKRCFSENRPSFFRKIYLFAFNLEYLFRLWILFLRYRPYSIKGICFTYVARKFLGN